MFVNRVSATFNYLPIPVYISCLIFGVPAIIFGKDLIHNFETQQWEGHPENSSDSVVKQSRNNFINLVKNAYRVLLSRAMKGCYVYFLDKETEKFFRSRIEL